MQLKRGTTAKNAEYLGSDGELTVDTDRDILVLHDGVQRGGRPIPRYGRNVLLNGNFGLWRYATSQDNAVQGYGSADRWFNVNSGSTRTVSRQAFALGQTAVPGNPEFYMRTAFTAGAGINDYVLNLQRVEGVETLSGGKVALSFWARSLLADLDFSVELRQMFGSGGSPTPARTSLYPKKFKLSQAFKKYTYVVSIPSVADCVLGTDLKDNLGLALWYDAGSAYGVQAGGLGHQSGTIDIAQIQLEAGGVVTEFDLRPPQLELLLNERYLRFINHTFSGDISNGGTYYVRTVLQPPMRAAPELIGTHAAAASGFPAEVGTLSASSSAVIESRAANATAAAGLYSTAIKASAEL